MPTIGFHCSHEQIAPGRFWAALGSGEASNERVTGEAWPRRDVRDARLLAGEEANR